MTDPVRWTVVSPAADHSPPAASAASLMSWLAAQPAVELHSVLWASGPAGTVPFDHGRFTNVGAAHDRLAPRALRRIGLVRLGGGLAGRAVRSTLTGVPSDGVLYLSSAHAAPVLRYLPVGRRRVITHLHARDRQAEPGLAEDKVSALVAATDIWLADDEETRAWATTTWGLDADEITVVAPPVDPRTWNRATKPTGTDQLRLGLAGGDWFTRDHSARLVQVLHRRRPNLRLELVWTRAVTTTDHLGPLLHDLDRLGMADALEVSPMPDGPVPVLEDVDAVALTLPDDDAPWLTTEALSRGVPMVCFDSHRDASFIGAGGGGVVAYPDVGAMAQALLDINEDDGRGSVATGLHRQGAALRERDVAVIGPRILTLATPEQAS